MRILVCGDRSFAAKGVVALLQGQGHEVYTFSRGKVAATANAVTGPVTELENNPHLAGEFDTVINYILLKDESIERNNAFLGSLLRFCAARPVKHLIHFSSISSYKAATTLVREDEEIEQTPGNKGPYGALKVATDLYLLAEAPKTLKITMLRPGFILGAGVMSPIIGTAARLPWNRLLVIGNKSSTIPCTTRELVSKAVAHLAANPPTDAREVLLLADPNSPTREEFLDVCCRELGAGKGVSSLPVWLWWMIAFGGEIFARCIGQGQLKPYQKLTARLSTQRFDTSKSTKRLGFEQRVDWKSALRESLDDQEPNFNVDALFPPEVMNLATAKTPANEADPVTFVGFGRIARTRHLPALRRLGLDRRIMAYDPFPSGPPRNVEVRAMNGAVAGNASLFVVASPGPNHIDAIPFLSGAKGPLLVEKPLCYNEPELRQWIDFSAARGTAVSVCHNYRFKKNVLAMARFLKQYNPGKLHHVMLEFQSPPVSGDSVAWLRNERAARTLLMDYSIHFLDLACMFSDSRWTAGDLRYELNSSNQTSLIEGRLTSTYSVSFLLRQGFAPRRARLRFNFQNYCVSLGFFPDTFVPYMADDNPWLYRMESKAVLRATARKIFDRLSGRDSDASHAAAFAAAIATANNGPLRVDRLASFYRAAFAVGDAVYK